MKYQKVTLLSLKWEIEVNLLLYLKNQIEVVNKERILNKNQEITAKIQLIVRKETKLKDLKLKGLF